MNVWGAEHSFRPEEVDGLVVLCVVHEHVDGLVEPQMGLRVVEGRGGRTVEHTRVQAVAIQGRDDLFQTAGRRLATLGGLGGAHAAGLRSCASVTARVPCSQAATAKVDSIS